MPPKLADNIAEVAVVIPLWSRGCLGWLLEAGSLVPLQRRALSCQQKPPGVTGTPGLWCSSVETA